MIALLRSVPARPALLLALVWLVVALLLQGWAMISQPRSSTRLAGEGGTIMIAPAPPARGVLSVWVWWDASRGADGWVVLEAGDPWPPAAEAFWRRRVHPGWNLLVWSQASTLPEGAAVRLRAMRGTPAHWGIAEPVVSDGYRLDHLVELRGLLIALVMTAFAGAASVVRGLRARRRRDEPLAAIAWSAGLVAIAAIAVVLRVRTLTTQSLWFDEVLTAIGVQSFDWVLYTPQVFGHPPLHYLAGWLFGGAGTHDGWLRGPFVASGVATVVAVAWLGRQLFGAATGMVAGLALALLPFHVELSQTARPYAPFLFLSVVSATAMVSAMRTGSAAAWTIFSATTALGIYTHYLGTTLLIIEAVTMLLLFGLRRARGAGAALVSFVAVGILLAPWAPVLARLFVTQVGRGDLTGSTLHRLVVDVFVPQFLGPGTATTLGVVLVARGLWALRRRPDVAVPIGLWLAVPVVLVWAAQPSHFLAGRHLALVVPPLFLVLARGVTAFAADVARVASLAVRTEARWPARIAGTATVAVLVATWTFPVTAGLRGYYESRRGADWRTVAGLLNEAVASHDRVVATVGAGYPLRHYWRADVEVLDPDALERMLTSRPGERLWIVRHRGWDRPPELDHWLERHAVRVADVPPSWSQPGVDVYRAFGR